MKQKVYPFRSPRLNGTLLATPNTHLDLRQLRQRVDGGVEELQLGRRQHRRDEVNHAQVVHVVGRVHAGAVHQGLAVWGREEGGDDR